MQAGRKLVNKLWNVARFVKPLLTTESIGKSKPELENFSDRWIMAELQKLISECTKALEDCNFNKARVAVEKFFWSKYCDNYLELCKDRVWKPEKYSADQLDSLRYTLAISMDVILKLFAPIIPFASEEIYHVLFETDEAESIHVSAWPEPNHEYENDDLVNFGPNFLDIISKIRHFKTIEIKNLRAEISCLSIVSDSKFVPEAINDLAALGGAKEHRLGEQSVYGYHYESYGSDIYLST